MSTIAAFAATYGAAMTAVVGAVSAATSAYGANKSRQLSRKSMAQQEKLARDQMAAEEQAMNKANAKQADITSLIEASDTTGAFGNTTNLTGANGILSGGQNYLGQGNKLGV